MINSNMYKTFNHHLFFVLIYSIKGDGQQCVHSNIIANLTRLLIGQRQKSMFNIIMRRNYVNLILIKLLHVYGHVNLSF